MADRTSTVVASGIMVLAVIGVVSVFGGPILSIVAPPPAPAEVSSPLAPLPARPPIPQDPSNAASKPDANP